MMITPLGLKKRQITEDDEDDNVVISDETASGPAQKKLKQKQLLWAKPQIALLGILLVVERVTSIKESTEGKENFTSADIPRGLYNESNTCYLNSLIQVLFHLHPFRDLIFSLQLQHQPEKLSVLEALQWLFLDLAERTDESDVITTNRLTKAFGWTSINRGLQQDINEFMQTLFGSLEKELSADDFIKLSSLFTGRTKRTIKCDAVSYESVKTEDVRGVALPTISHLNIERSLAELYSCEEIEMTIEGHGRQQAQISSELTESPQVLLLTLNRLKYDITEQAVVKVTDHFAYGDKLEFCGHVYRLHSVVVHEGTADAGHYYCYIHPTCNKKWFMFNDQDVSVTDSQSAIRDNYGRKNDPGGPTAYLVTYIRQDCKDFFRPCQQEISEKLQNRISKIRSEERARLERIQTAHLYTTVSLVSWAMIQSHCGYDVCDRLRVDNLHKSGEGAVKEGIYNMRVMKSSSVCELASQYDETVTDENSRLWTFTDRDTSDGWSTHRPDKLIKDWKQSVATVSQLRCPFYIYIERLGTLDHPLSISTDVLSIFIKLYSVDERSLKLTHHLILPLDMTIGELKTKISKMADISLTENKLNILQEHSSMWTEQLSYEDDTLLCEALSGQVIRHGTVLIAEIVGNYQSEQSAALEHMRKLGQSVHITWYNKNMSYLPSSDGDFTLEVYLDQCIQVTVQRLAEHLKCDVRNLQIYETKRDRGYPQICDSPVYDSDNTESLLQLVYKQVQHSHLWRHSAVLFYQQLEMSIEEMSLRHQITCEYISSAHTQTTRSHDQHTQTVTLYPLRCQGCETKQESTVEDLLELATEKLNPGAQLRLLEISGRRIMTLYQPERLISTILDRELRLEVIPESEEDVESEFSKVLASVLNDSANLVRKGIQTDPFLMVVDRSETGVDIEQRICDKLKISDNLKQKIEFRMVVHGESSITLPEGKLTVKHWADLTHDDDTGSFEMSNYIKITDAH